MNQKQGVIDTLTSGVEGLLGRRSVTVFSGVGELAGGKKVKISGSDDSKQVISGDNIILASGSKPKSISGFEVDGTLVVTSDQLLSLTKVPSRAVIIGGGAIAELNLPQP